MGWESFLIDKLIFFDRCSNWRKVPHFPLLIILKVFFHINMYNIWSTFIKIKFNLWRVTNISQIKEYFSNLGGKSIRFGVEGARKLRFIQIEAQWTMQMPGSASRVHIYILRFSSRFYTSLPLQMKKNGGRLRKATIFFLFSIILRQFSWCFSE